MSQTPSPTDYNFRAKDCLLGAQMLFVAFGALVLVPLLTGLNANVALFTAGVGTLIFQLITRGRVPVFLASSFAFIAPIIIGGEGAKTAVAGRGIDRVMDSLRLKRVGVERFEEDVMVSGYVREA